jgi:DNA (cytosine-5)-methyltransferase 1
VDALSNQSVHGIDLFASAGGLTLGFRAAGLNTICAVEVDRYRVQTFQQHNPGATIISSDIRQVNLSSYKGKVELVYGGPPCQPFSSGGLRQAASDERDMVPEFVRAIHQIKPRAFLMENVPGLAVAERLGYLTKVLDSLEDLGYCINWKVLNAADYGVPQ